MIAGGFFRARLSFPPEYPLLPPKMKFETPIFHPNSMSPHKTCRRKDRAALHTHVQLVLGNQQCRF